MAATHTNEIQWKGSTDLNSGPVPLNKKLWLMRQNKGFISISLTILLPILLTAFLAISILIFSTQSLEARNFACQKSVLESQTQSAKYITRLLKLNPIILGLRISLKAAYATFALAAVTYNPALAAQASRQIVSIQKQQRALYKLQNSLIQFARLEMNSVPFRFQRRLKDQPSSFLPGRTTPFFKGAIPAVEPKEHGLVPPLYQLKPNFEEQQKISLTWQGQWTLGGFQWINNFLPMRTLKLSQSCAGTLERKKQTGQFQARLIQAKSWLKP